jgi:hypothetical protein
MNMLPDATITSKELGLDLQILNQQLPSLNPERIADFLVMHPSGDCFHDSFKTSTSIRAFFNWYRTYLV